MEISKEDAQIILALLERVQVSGKEVMTVAQLQSKLQKGIQVPNTEGLPKGEEKPAKKD